MSDLANSTRATIATLVPDGRGGYVTPVFERDLGDGTHIEGRSFVSSEGMRQMRCEADLFDSMRDTFAALAGLLGRCPHGEDIDDLMDDGVLEWSINDYCCDPFGDPLNVFWMLYGMHADGEWCFARSLFRGVLCDYDASNWFTPLLWLGEHANVVEMPR